MILAAGLGDDPSRALSKSAIPTWATGQTGVGRGIEPHSPPGHDPLRPHHAIPNFMAVRRRAARRSPGSEPGVLAGGLADQTGAGCLDLHWQPSPYRGAALLLRQAGIWGDRRVLAPLLRLHRPACPLVHHYRHKRYGWSGAPDTPLSDNGPDRRTAPILEIRPGIAPGYLGFAARSVRLLCRGSIGTGARDRTPIC